jgi:RNA polymerase sigma-70 factor (ECF subfamily)
MPNGTTSPVSSSSSLITRLKARDADAWRRLSHLYGPIVYGWLRRAGLQDGDAADVVQDVFLAVAQGIDAFRRDRPGDTFRGWLWTIARSKMHDHFRRRAGEPQGGGGTTFQQRVQQLPEQPDEQQLAAETHSLARRAMALIETDFEPATWRAFWRTAVDGQPAQQVADELNISVASVYTAKSRVLSRLRQELADPVD